MRVRSIEVANGEEHIKLACAPCGTEATQSTKLPDKLFDLPSVAPTSDFEFAF
jgi:hypothetical protein